MISGLSDEKFTRLMAEHFTPAQPISKIEHLYGRDKKNREIQRAFASPGKHVFVFGDRGVGKTSLAKTSAAIRANCDVKSVPFVSCDQGSSFYDTCSNIFREILRVNPKLLDNLKIEANIDVWFFKLSGSKQIGSDTPSGTATSVHEVADRLRQLTASVSECLVVIDEFDQIASQIDRKLFADLIKQVSDREIPVRFVITGIGRSLEELIGVHLSTDRYLAPVALEPIPHDARWKIVDNAAEAIGIKIPRDFVIRIGQISDGFPYYVHLMGEKIFWAAYDSAQSLSAITPEVYKEGMRQAIEETTISLKRAYDMAIQKHKNSEDYEHALWSVADGPMLKKQVSDIFDNNYLRIMEDLQRASRLTKEAFYQRLNKLKRATHGSILIANKQGWYEFSENIIRGYVRLRAEQAGVTIGIDHIKG